MLVNHGNPVIHVHCNYDMFLSDVTIGFQPTNYSVNEIEGSVTLTAVVLAGELDRNITINFMTMSGTAIGITTLSLPVSLPPSSPPHFSLLVTVLYITLFLQMVTTLQVVEYDHSRSPQHSSLWM